MNALFSIFLFYPPSEFINLCNIMFFSLFSGSPSSQIIILSCFLKTNF
ncbi:hypothetical protein THER_1720 [Thermodesulfovibrio sp. N1]|nr:hypothetical protein THER_1720 [Thermodesulfovibrio sp. N1]